MSLGSDTSSLLSGSVSSAAAKAPLKVSKTIVRERSIVFWTPVMVWPTGFLKAHKKYPLIASNLIGGIIIDLHTTDVES
jgi:hypothetical protein